MNCEQCKEQVFELIEREAIDAAAVEEVLDRCPDCRALFEDMKAALVAMDQMPLEDPPAHIDAEVLRAAATRRSNVVPFRKNRTLAPPWAMAAIALLAVGVGVWSLPGEAPSTDAIGDSSRGATGEEAAPPTQEVFEAESATALGKLSDAKPQPAAKEASLRTEQAPRKSGAKKLERQNLKRKSREISARQASPPAEAPAVVAEQDAVTDSALAGAAAPKRDGTSDDAGRRGVAAGALSEVAADEEKKAQEKLSVACRKTLAAQERRERRQDESAPDPETQLALGRCYAEAGNTERARAWLTRAATHPKTKTRARAALRKLPASE